MKKAHLLVSLDPNPKAKGMWFYRLDWDHGYIVESGYSQKCFAVIAANSITDVLDVEVIQNGKS